MSATAASNHAGATGERSANGSRESLDASQELSPHVEGALGGGGFATGLDPLEIALTLARMLSPRHLVPELPELVAQLARAGVGTSGVEIGDDDRRFADPAWRDNPLYRRLGQAYLALEQTGDRLVERSASTVAADRARYVANIALGAVAPTNYLLGNPEALKRAFDTGGRSVLRGARNAVRDVVTNKGIPKSVNRRPFTVGENIATTPGAVVYREEMFEVLQYTPQTSQVRSVPLVFFPPPLNRYYILDLAPGKSMIEYAVQHGVQTLAVVWRNPRKDTHGHWGLDDYIAATVRALAAVREITGSDEVSCVGLCAGGLTTAIALSYMAAQGDLPATSLTLLVTMLDTSRSNMVSTLATSRVERLLQRDAEAEKVVDYKAVVRNFALMRPDDLVYSYVAKGWLQGAEPPAFDVLAWNADATNVTSKFERDTMRVLSRNLLSESGACELLDTPIDLGAVTCDNFIVAGMRDHITTWRPCYLSSQVLGGESEVVVATTGHIQTFVNPPGKSRYQYWRGPDSGLEPDDWLDATPQHDGSWWPDWIDWLLQRSGAEKRAPAKLGNNKHKAMGEAPGTYVHEV